MAYTVPECKCIKYDDRPTPKCNCLQEELDKLKIERNNLYWHSYRIDFMSFKDPEFKDPEFREVK